MRIVLILALTVAVGLTVLTGCREEERGARTDVPGGEEHVKIAREPQEIVDEYMAKVGADHQLKEYDIKSSVLQDGTMTLTGQVPNEDMKKKAGRLARTVLGVRTIKNDLQITGEEVTKKAASDRAMRRELEKKIKADIELKEYPISVSVAKGKATVEGFVATRTERRKVTELGETVAGLTEIDDQLRLSGELKDEFMAKVEADNQLKEYPIEVWVEKGNILKMKGTLPNRAYRRKAETLAKTVAGVRKIENDIEVEGIEFPPEKVLTDKQLQKEIERKMAADSELKKYDISVEVERGQAVLKGSVSDHKDKRKAAALTRTVDGISKVDNQIERKKEKEVATDRVWPRASAKYINDLL